MPEFECRMMGRNYYIPDRMMDGINLYVKEGFAPGSFLTAVICNDLKEAFACADDENFHQVPAYVNYFYNDIPANCHGSKKKMDAWIKYHQERRKENA